MHMPRKRKKIFCEKRGLEVEVCNSVEFCEQKSCKLKKKKARKVKRK